MQRGGSLVFQDGVAAFRHDDQGILGYCPEERLVAKALSEDPAAVGLETTFHRVMLQSKHQLMTAGMVHVTNPTHTREWQP